MDVIYAGPRDQNITIDYEWQMTEFGKTLVCQVDSRVCYIGFGRDAFAKMSAFFSSATVREGHVLPYDDINKIALYGTEFQMSVWNALLQIPCGETLTYGDVAKAIGKPKAVRAVGTAIGKNPVSILVPCHRVLPSSGGVGNYGWGSEMKEKILKAEKAL